MDMLYINETNHVGFTIPKSSPVPWGRPGRWSALGAQSKSVQYDELVIATGSKPWLPPVPGLGLEAQDVEGWPSYVNICVIFLISYIYNDIDRLDR